MKGALVFTTNYDSISLWKYCLEELNFNVNISSKLVVSNKSENFEGVDLLFIDSTFSHKDICNFLEKVNCEDINFIIVILYEREEIEIAKTYMRLGVFDYVPKNLRRESIFRIIKQALRHKRILDKNKKHEIKEKVFNSHLKAIFNSVQDAIITIDKDMRITHANSAFENICGIDLKHVLGKEIFNIRFKCNMECLRFLEDNLYLKKIPQIEGCYINCNKKDRENQIVIITVTPLKTNHNINGFVIVLRDVTKLKMLENKIKLKKENIFKNIIGISKKMEQVFTLMNALRNLDTTVLLTGESGTGKNLIAKELHYAGNRAKGPFVIITCSSLTESLLESELFGHVKGAFTGAIKDYKGKLSMAHQGTIFLDEIGDIPLRLQQKLLRFLEEKEFERVGDNKPIRVNVRVIAATNVNLVDKVRAGQFRKDLYYRLKVMEIKIPPLRERIEDIPLLVQHFIEYYSKKFKKPVKGISSDVIEIFKKYTWPGNVRELKNIIEHAYILCDGPIIEKHHLPEEIVSITANIVDKNEILKEEDLIIKALEKTGGNKAKAAKLLGISRQTLYRKLKKYNLLDIDFT